MLQSFAAHMAKPTNSEWQQKPSPCTIYIKHPGYLFDLHWWHYVYIHIDIIYIYISKCKPLIPTCSQPSKGPFFLRNRKPKSSDPSHQSFSTGSNQALGGKGAGTLFSITDNPIAGPGFFLEKRLTFRAGKGGHTDMTTYGKNMKMKLLWLQFLVLWPNLELMTLFLCFCPRKKTTAPKKVLFCFQ